MAKRGGLGRGLDALIPEKKPAKVEKPAKEGKPSKKSAAGKITPKKPSGKVSKSEKETKSYTEDDLLKNSAKETASEELTIIKEQTASEIASEAENTIPEGSKNLSDEYSEDEFGSLFEEFAEDEGPSESVSTVQPGIAEEEEAETAAEQSGIAEEEKKETQGDAVVLMRITDVEPNRDQPRKYFDDDSITELADSISQFGIIQPLLVQEREGYYEIIAGERRWRAARKAGLKEVPVIIKRFTNQEAVEVALVENIQREDLNPIEEAKAYERLVKEYGLSQEDVAGRVSKSRTAVTNSMRLLRLDADVQKMVETSQISEGHARAILGVPSPELQRQMAETIVKEKLSVRQTEKLVRDTTKPRGSKRQAEISKEDIMLRGLSENLKTALGTKVNIRSTGKNKGKIEIDYYSEEELDRIYEMLLTVR